MLLTRISCSLVNSAKAAASQAPKASTLIFSDANTKAATVGGSPTGGSESESHTTKTREEFAKVWPYRYRLQEHHLNELKTNHTPVHMSGPMDKYVVPAFTFYTIGLTIYSAYKILTL